MLIINSISKVYKNNYKNLLSFFLTAFITVHTLCFFSPALAESKNKEQRALSSLQDDKRDKVIDARILNSEILPEQLLQIADTQAFAKYVFIADKSQRRLFLYERSGTSIKLVEAVPADIGKNGGNKTKANDKKTPEGIYFFQKHLKPPEIPFEQYGKMAFTLDYPNIFDEREKKTGGGIWLHSVPDTVPLTRGSRGCVVVRNDIIEKVFNFIQLKETPILIFDKVNFVPPAEHSKKREEILSFITSWKSAWQSKDIDKYLDFYDSDFKSLGFNFKKWKRYKQGLIEKYGYIKVDFDQPFILIHNNQLIIKTLQKYESDKHKDFGIKVIHALKQNDKYKIISEEWKEADPKGFELISQQSQSESLAQPQSQNQLQSQSQTLSPTERKQ